MPKVLIADDSLSVRKVAERLLTAAGFDVALAANGEEALAGVANLRPDLVLADVIMPDKSGFEVCLQLKAHTTWASTPVLLMSGVVDDEIKRQADVCHADGVIKKPFLGSSLQDQVWALIASRPQSQPDAAGNVMLGVPKVFRITEEQLEKVRHAAAWARDMEAQLLAEQKRAAQFEEQTQAFRETALQAAARIRELEIKLAEEERRSTLLKQRIAEMEHTAGCAERLAEAVAEITKLAGKARRSSGP